MNCPRCKKPNTKVVDSRSIENVTWRRRRCQHCRFRFHTIETITYETKKNILGLPSEKKGEE